MQVTNSAAGLMLRMVPMSSQTVKLQVLRGIGLSTGVALLLASGNAMAMPRTGLLISQANPSRDVVVDTEETGPSTTRSTTRTSPGRSSNPIYDSSTRFGCQMVNGEYTVVYQPESRSGEYFPWATPSAMGGGWSPERRCNEIARRLESYRPQGLLELTTGVENNYNTVCVITEANQNCQIVFTVPPGQDPVVTRDRVFENLTIADSGQQTDSVYTYRGRQANGIDELVNMGRSILGGGNDSRGSKSINLRPFLDKADGGTGTQLRGECQSKRERQSVTTLVS